MYTIYIIHSTILTIIRTIICTMMYRLWRLQSLDMDAAAQRIQRSNVLTIHGSADDRNPVAEAHKFSAIRSHDVAIIDGADHNFSNLEHGAALVDKLVEFLTRGV
eukprot:evm.model.scf_1120.2 EVM.evm.TU.scf_1120.2   scf_1120:9518-9832(-)